MSSKLVLATICAAISGAAYANADAYLMQKAKSEQIAVTKSENHIDFTPMKSYDKYIISVSGENGFYTSYESQMPSIDVNSLNLPTDGTYSYQIKAVTHLKEVQDTMNNGRSEEARGFISKTDVSNGKFTTENFAIKTYKQLSEAKPVVTLGLDK